MRISIPAPLVRLLQNARHVVILTGAGISAESGIPTFRDALTGLWENFDAEDLATPDAFRRDRALVWGWYESRRMKLLRVQPNAGHRAIAAMARYLPALTLITQNVDDLHERAGSTDVAHLHGSLNAPRCFACARGYSAPLPNIDDLEVGGCREPPRCTHCGGLIRPGVVWFGEPLPEKVMRKARVAALNCDLFFSIGTSAVVFPAADLPIMAAKKGATVVQINVQPTDLDRLAQFNLQGPAGEILPAILEAAWNQSV